MSDDHNMDDVRRSAGLAAMQTIDAVNEEFLLGMTDVQTHIVAAYKHLIDHDIEHIRAIGMVHGIVGAMMERARVGEGPE